MAEVRPTPIIASDHESGPAKNQATPSQKEVQYPHPKGLDFGSGNGLACKAMVSPTKPIACSINNYVPRFCNREYYVH